MILRAKINTIFKLPVRQFQFVSLACHSFVCVSLHRCGGGESLRGAFVPRVFTRSEQIGPIGVYGGILVLFGRSHKYLDSTAEILRHRIALEENDLHICFIVIIMLRKYQILGVLRSENW